MKQAYFIFLCMLLLFVSLLLVACSGDKGSSPFFMTGTIGGVVTLSETGQTNCYNESGVLINCTGTGQDGEKQAGVGWPVPRFMDNGNGTVTDTLTGLVWMQDGGSPTIGVCAGGMMTLPAALSYVACLNANSYAGHTDWRLPNRKEMRSLMNYGMQNTAAWLNTQGFTNAKGDSSLKGFDYWSSTSSGNSAFIFGIGTSGRVSTGFKLGSLYAWPICGVDSQSFPARLPMTGQTKCYDTDGMEIACGGTGQDGEKRSGVGWMSPRFTTGTGASADCVTDNLTGLMWVKAPDATGRTRAGALVFAEGLSLCGNSDWRLPNVSEMESLYHAGVADVIGWLNTQGFNITRSGDYWTSTTHAYSPGSAWIVTIYSGYVSTWSKTMSSIDGPFTWPVRGGQ